MKLTEQQKEIVDYDGDLIVSAVAGSGKSTTVLHHCLERPNKKKLILFFNKSMADEMKAKAGTLGIKNIDISTSHSLAFNKMNIRGNYEVGNFTPYDVLKLISKMKYSRENLAFCYAAIQYLIKFCQSDADKLDQISKSFFSVIPYTLYKSADQSKLIKLVQKIEELIDDKKLPMTHYLYLKRFQLQKIKLDYDHIYIDEFQDTAPVVFDIFKNQDHAIRMCIGDSSQSINSWNGAIDAMNKVDFPLKELNKSFRFGSGIADFANRALQLKSLIGRKSPLIEGAGGEYSNGLTAYLSRTNSQILNQAIDDVFLGSHSKVHFEGGFDAYVNSGAYSVYDVLNLKIKNKDQIKSDFIHHFEDYELLKEYAEESQDVELSRSINLVDKHGKSLLKYIPELKKSHVDKKSASRVYSTAHKSKGQEYSKVVLLNGFIDSGTISKTLKVTPLHKLDEIKNELEQEIHLLYVSRTRAMKELIEI